MTMPAIRVLCVDDNPKLRAAWGRLLDREPDLELVGVLSRADELVETAQSRSADVVLLDLTMEGKDPLEAVIELSQRRPGTRVVIYSGSSEAEHVDRAIAAGAWGYVDKLAEPGRVVDAIRRVARGEIVLPGSGD